MKELGQGVGIMLRILFWWAGETTISEGEFEDGIVILRDGLERCDEYVRSSPGLLIHFAGLLACLLTLG